jgi:phosphatidylinositol alpha-1,6-mannosyltransferase
VVASVNGIDVDRFAPNVDAGRQIRARHGISPDAPVLLHCSRLEPEKGAQLSIRAFSLIRRTRHDAQLLVAGDGSQREELRVLANRLGIAEAVHFIGHVGNDDLPAYYNACDVFLYPTLAVESFGIAVAEAMACGRPVVASRRGGIRTSIDHPATGLLVPPGQVEALAHATRSLLADPQARQHMGAAARIKSVEALSVSRMVDDFLAVALRIAGRHLAGNP